MIKPEAERRAPFHFRSPDRPRRDRRIEKMWVRNSGETISSCMRTPHGIGASLGLQLYRQFTMRIYLSSIIGSSRQADEEFASLVVSEQHRAYPPLATCSP